jgi:PKD domain-containing protein
LGASLPVPMARLNSAAICVTSPTLTGASTAPTWISDTFHNEWQTYRTRKDKSLQLEITHTYADPGEYTIVVKVIDILGNDTTKTVKVKVV